MARIGPSHSRSKPAYPSPLRDIDVDVFWARSMQLAFSQGGRPSTPSEPCNTGKTRGKLHFSACADAGGSDSSYV
jgi:hypothetical protein